MEGGKTDDAKTDEKEKEAELTPEEKAEEERQLQEVRKKTSEILWGYIKKFKCLLAWGFLFNILGMIGEFASPLFIGLVIDAIVLGDQDEVVYLIVIWMIINTVSYILGNQIGLGWSVLRRNSEIHFPADN